MCCLYCYSIHEVLSLLLKHSWSLVFIVGAFMMCCPYCWSIHDVLSLLLKHSWSLSLLLEHSWCVVFIFGAFMMCCLHYLIYLFCYWCSCHSVKYLNCGLSTFRLWAFCLVGFIWVVFADLWLSLRFSVEMVNICLPVLLDTKCFP